MTRLVLPLLTLLFCCATTTQAQHNVHHYHVLGPGDGPGSGGGPTGGGQTDDDSPRLLFWAHGFMGDRGSWTRANDYVANNMGGESNAPSARWSRLSQTHLLGYEDAPGVAAGASDLRGQLATHVNARRGAEPGHDPTQNIVVAHSFGGLASRRLYQDYIGGGTLLNDRTFGGLATFGTPHNGAEFARSVDDIDQFVVDGCIDVGSAWLVGRVGEFETPLPIGFDGLTTGAVRGLTNVFCNGVVGTLTNLLTEPVTATQARVDLIPNSTALTNLQGGDEGPLQRQAFYGAETQEDLLWRVAPTLLGSARINNDAGAQFISTADDPAFLNEIAAMRAEYQRRGDLWASRRNANRWYIAPACFDFYNGNYYECDWMEDLRDTYYDGADWLRNADMNYKQLAGFFETVAIGTVIDEYCLVDGTTIDRTRLNPTQCHSWYGSRGDWTTIRTTTTTLQALENDGVVLRSSAEDYGAAPFRMEGSNHFSMRNDVNTRLGLESLLDGQLNDYFESEID